MYVPYAFGDRWTDLDETWWGDTLWSGEGFRPEAEVLRPEVKPEVLKNCIFWPL